MSYIYPSLEAACHAYGWSRFNLTPPQSHQEWSLSPQPEINHEHFQTPKAQKSCNLYKDLHAFKKSRVKLQALENWTESSRWDSEYRTEQNTGLTSPEMCSTLHHTYFLGGFFVLTDQLVVMGNVQTGWKMWTVVFVYVAQEGFLSEKNREERIGTKHLLQ